MKKIIQCSLVVMLIIIATQVNAQVKFGNNKTTINANSLLELESTNKGLLLPRVALTAINAASPMSAHVEGMVVYNTATAGTAPNNVTPGYYYNDGTKWNRIATSPDILLPNISITSSTAPTGLTTGQVVYNTTNVAGPPAIPIGPVYWDGTKWVPFSGNDWTTSGNSVNGGNFLGTTNNASLRIRTNNTQKMVIDSMGKVGIGTTAPVSTLEVNGSATNTAASSSTTRSINFATSNLAYTTASAGAFTLTGMKDGGTYTLAVQGATAGTSSFTHAGLTFRQVNNVATTASKHTLYTFIVMGTTVYFWMNGGL